MTTISARKGFRFSSRRANSLTFCPLVGSEERGGEWNINESSRIRRKDEEGASAPALPIKASSISYDTLVITARG